MNIYDKVNNSYKRHIKKLPPSIPTVIKLIRTNHFDYSNPAHLRMKRVAIKHGYIDEDLNILKEVK